LAWFSILALPFALIGIATMGVSIASLMVDGVLSTSIAGTGLLFLVLALFLFFNGALGELIYQTGDIRPDDFIQHTNSQSRK